MQLPFAPPPYLISERYLILALAAKAYNEQCYDCSSNYPTHYFFLFTFYMMSERCLVLAAKAYNEQCYDYSSNYPTHDFYLQALFKFFSLGFVSLAVTIYYHTYLNVSIFNITLFCRLNYTRPALWGLDYTYCVNCSFLPGDFPLIMLDIAP